jgi:hypothetical protein
VKEMITDMMIGEEIDFQAAMALTRVIDEVTTMIDQILTTTVDPTIMQGIIVIIEMLEACL